MLVAAGSAPRGPDGVGSHRTRGIQAITAWFDARRAPLVTRPALTPERHNSPDTGTSPFPVRTADEGLTTRRPPPHPECPKASTQWGGQPRETGGLHGVSTDSLLAEGARRAPVRRHRARRARERDLDPVDATGP